MSRGIIRAPAREISRLRSKTGTAISASSFAFQRRVECGVRPCTSIRTCRGDAGASAALGLPADVVHRFEATVTGGRWVVGGEARALLRTAIGAELILIPDFDRPGTARQLYAAPAYSELRVEATRADETMTDLRILARVGITSWHKKALHAGCGYNLLLGIGSAYEYGQHVGAARAGDTVTPSSCGSMRSSAADSAVRSLNVCRTINMARVDSGVGSGSGSQLRVSPFAGGVAERVSSMVPSSRMSKSPAPASL